MTDWIYEGQPLLEPIEGAYGYLYAIVADNKTYYGKKAFTHSTKKRISKREIAATKTRKRVRRVTTDSQWKNYYGSCQPLLEWIKENGKENVSRIIIGFAKTKMDLSYWETALLIEERVLFRDDTWNGNVAGKYYKGKINEPL